VLLTVLRFNFGSPQGDPRTQGKLIAAALELAQWGESRGITTISVDEHHVTGHGWSCNPVMAAAMFLARTERLIASVDCALGPLWNPVRLAEDIALVDNMSRGRLHTTVGLGYRTVEYDSLGVDFSQRGKLMDNLVERMLSVWSGADPDAGACTGTWTRPHPPLHREAGGALRAAAQPGRPPAGDRRLLSRTVRQRRPHTVRHHAGGDQSRNDLPARGSGPGMGGAG
jgi:alkanesulfonate monooxygenase SsuD/methylene tetrahydromethanopterin reductase-like flavin-dependent oxidoreductase (luciferase family)